MEEMKRIPSYSSLAMENVQFSTMIFPLKTLFILEFPIAAFGCRKVNVNSYWLYSNKIMSAGMRVAMRHDATMLYLTEQHGARGWREYLALFKYISIHWDGNNPLSWKGRVSKPGGGQNGSGPTHCAEGLQWFYNNDMHKSWIFLNASLAYRNKQVHANHSRVKCVWMFTLL